MVAAHARGLAVHRQARAAPETFGFPSARRAFERRREAATIDEHQPLLAALKTRHQRGPQCSRNAVVRIGVAIWHEGNFRHAGARIGAHGKKETAIPARVNLCERFERGRCARQYDRHIARARAPHGDIAGVVADAVLLFVGSVVLLVDDDQRKARQCAKHRQPRAEHQIRVAACGGIPIRAPLAIGQSAVKGHGMCARQPCTHARFELRRQVDLGNKEQHLSRIRDRRFRGGEKDVGLAAARHTLKQKRRERSGCVANRVGSGLLVTVQRLLDGRILARLHFGALA